MIQQIAFRTYDIDKSVELLMEAGYSRWVRDRVEMLMWTMPVENDGVKDTPPDKIIARMAFNYELLDGMEYELIQTEGDSYLDTLGINGGDVAWFGFSIDNPDEGAELLDRFGATHLIQECMTYAHARNTSEDVSYIHRYYSCDRIPQILKLYWKIAREDALAQMPVEEEGS